MRNKGKVYPSPSSSSSFFSSSSSSISSSTANRDALSILILLPAAILALISVLSSEDQQVLAYMITRSMKSPNPSSTSEEKKKNNKKSSNTHKPPVFDCDCFDCYTSYWFRWDSSPNRELIHQAIEAFEEHLATGEQSKRNGRGKRREKMGRRGNEKSVPEREDDVLGNDCPPVEVPVEAEGKGGDGEVEVDEVRNGSVEEEVAPPEAAAEAVLLRGLSENNHRKGLARKVLPDVVGLLNSRLWSLWGPNV